jgi:hypothetical protein
MTGKFSSHTSEMNYELKVKQGLTYVISSAPYVTNYMEQSP